MPDPREFNSSFIERLDKVEGDIAGTVSAIEDGMGLREHGVELGNKVREMIGDEDFASGEDTFTPPQVEGIDFLKSWIRFLCQRGVMGPRQIGLWITQPNLDTDYKSPLDTVLKELGKGTDQEQIAQKVLSASNAFCPLPPGDDSPIFPPPETPDD